MCLTEASSKQSGEAILEYPPKTGMGTTYFFAVNLMFYKLQLDNIGNRQLVIENHPLHHHELCFTHSH